MRRMAAGAAFIGLTAGALTGCGGGWGGEKTIEQPGAVVGFAHGVDSQLWEERWVSYHGETRAPHGAVRSLVVDEEGRFDGCYAVGDGYFSFDTDDDECGGFFGDGSDCDADEGEHCEARYSPTYSYEQQEDHMVKDCPAGVRRQEYVPRNEQTTINPDCDRQRKDGQWVTRQDVYTVWVTTDNPDYDEKDPGNNPEVITGQLQITEEEWQAVSTRRQVTALVREGEVVDMSIDD